MMNPGASSVLMNASSSLLLTALLLTNSTKNMSQKEELVAPSQPKSSG